MAIAHVQSVQQNSGVTGSSSTPTATLSAATAGNFLVSVLQTADGTNDAVPPTGFDVACRVKTGTNARQIVIAYKKQADGGETALAWSGLASAAYVVTGHEYSGVDPLTPLDIASAQVTAAASGVSACNTPSVSITAGDKLVIAGFGARTSTSFSAETIGGSSSGLTERTDNGATSASLAVVDRIYTASAGSISGASTMANTNVNNDGAIAVFNANTPSVYAVPTSTINNASTAWRRVSDSTSTNIHQYVDDLDGAINDANSDAIYDLNASAQVLELKFGPLTDPVVHTGHRLLVRLRSPTGLPSSSDLATDIYQGATLIASLSLTPNETLTQSSTAIWYSGTLSTTQAANITDYTDLRVRLRDNFGNNDLYITAVRFAVPATSINQTVNQASETDLSQPIGRLKTAALNQAAEGDAAQPITPLKSQTIGQATETDTAFSITRLIGLSAVLNQATETDTALPITPKIIRLLNTATETDEAQPMQLVFGVPKIITLGTAYETDTAGGISAYLYEPPAILPTRLNKTVWKFELINSATMLPICELTQARNRVLNLALNKAGSFSFTVPLEDANTAKINEITTGVMISLNGQPVWSGAVWTVQEQTPNTVNVGCVGWLQTLEKRFSKPNWGNSSGNLVFAQVDAGFIAQQLLRYSNTDAGNNPSYVFPGNTQISQQRDRTYQPYINVLNEIVALSEVESGFDFEVTPYSRRLNIYAKLQTIRPELQFEYTGNVNEVSRNSDVGRMCNRFIAYSGIGSAQVDDAQSQAIYGILEDTQGLTDVVDMSILQAYAAAEVAVRAYPLRIATFTPRPFSSTNPDDPRIFMDFNIGDIGYLSAKKGRLQLDRQAVRIFGASVAFNDNGTESITSVQTTAS